jgi:hypothetical protein
MRLAIMQPYIFPYIGYYQLIKAVDKIVMYDDVSFIKQGWINRNRILLNDRDFTFTVPLKDVSSNKLIKDTLIDSTKYSAWTKKLLATISQAYRRAPYFEEVYNLIESIVNSNNINISELAVHSLKVTSNYIGIETDIIHSSVIYNNQHLKGKERIIDICKQEKAEVYINAVGGQELYSKEEFKRNGIILKFISSKPILYKQYGNEFMPWLSIIDLMMFNKVEEVRDLVDSFELI